MEHASMSIAKPTKRQVVEIAILTVGLLVSGIILGLAYFAQIFPLALAQMS